MTIPNKLIIIFIAILLTVQAYSIHELADRVRALEHLTGAIQMPARTLTVADWTIPPGCGVQLSCSNVPSTRREDEQQ
jgi:hypothetical protein